MQTNITLKIVVAGVLFTCSCFASAIPITCPGTPITGFGTGAFAMSTWQTCGTVTQLGSSAKIDTTTTMTSDNNAPTTALNAFLSPQAVSSQDGITPTEGSALKTTFTSGAGPLSFSYSFVSEPTIASYGFMLLDGTQYDLGHNSLVTTTPLMSLNVAIGAGSHNIAFGVMNKSTLFLDPNLTITNLNAPAAGIPEPATFGLAAGAFALAFMLRRYSQVSRT